MVKSFNQSPPTNKSAIIVCLHRHDTKAILWWHLVCLVCEIILINMCRLCRGNKLYTISFHGVRTEGAACSKPQMLWQRLQSSCLLWKQSQKVLLAIWGTHILHQHSSTVYCSGGTRGKENDGFSRCFSSQNKRLVCCNSVGNHRLPLLIITSVILSSFFWVPLCLMNECKCTVIDVCRSLRH